jgi:hypothetical protein
LRPARANTSQERPHLQNNQTKLDWRYDSSGRVLTKQAFEALSSNPSPKKKVSAGYSGTYL